jgi:hypothetical protein
MDFADAGVANDSLDVAIAEIADTAIDLDHHVALRASIAAGSGAPQTLARLWRLRSATARICRGLQS